MCQTLAATERSSVRQVVLIRVSRPGDYGSICKRAPLTSHISICFLRHRIECLLSATIVFEGTSEAVHPILSCIHFAQICFVR